VHRVISKGADPNRMGRWCWTRYRGRNNHTLRIFSCYCPSPPSGPLSVYSQQCSAMLTQGNERCPRIAFIEDLEKDLKQAQSDDDLLVVMMDGNTNMRDSPLAKMLAAYNLKEAILSKHGINCPATCKRNNSCTPIHSIWTSNEMGIKASRYLAYDTFMEGFDHRCLWLDITFKTAFGHNMYAMQRPQTRRLHCRDPRIVLNYVKQYEKL
jgi:hypothetical protein